MLFPLILVIISQAVSSAIFDYRFGLNFGKIFFDYSGNNLVAVNGISYNDSSTITTATDRGAYFSVGDCRISLPSNDLVQYPIYPSVFSLVVWAIFQDYSYYIFSRSSGAYFIKISRYSTQNQLSFHIKTLNFDTSELFSPISILPPSNFYLDIWTLIILTISTSLSLSVNSNTIISYTPPSPYSESGSYTTSLGYPSLSTSLVGIVWTLLLLDAPASVSDYLSPSSAACLVPGCSPCSPGIVSEGVAGCLSTQSSPTVDSFGTNCPDCSGGCSQSTCLVCTACVQETCQFASLATPQILCMCGGDSTSLATACQCPQYYFYTNSSCSPCNADCASCSACSTCDQCIASYAVSASVGCTCKAGYYNATALTDLNSCIPCNPLCVSCNSQGDCVSCYDGNADPSSNCVCNHGYFSENNSCIACYTECRTCRSFLDCEECVDSNALPGQSGCKCRNGYGASGAITYNGACVKCNEDCETCREVNVCTTCKDTNSYPADVGCVCSDGFYEYDGLCSRCPADCVHCNYTQCTSCWDASALPSGQGCYCPQGYFTEAHGLYNYTQCGKCGNDCSTCADGNSCSECRVVGSYPSGSGCTCPNFYYNDGIECAACENWNSEAQMCVFCQISQYFNGTGCISCPSLCLSCNENFCIYCKDNAQVYNNTCICSDMYQGSTQCLPVPFTLTTIADVNNNIFLIFSQDITNSISASDISLAIPGTNFHFAITGWSSRKYLISINYMTAVPNNASAKLIILSNITSVLNCTLDTDLYSVPLKVTVSSNSSTEITYQAQAKNNILILGSLSVILSLLNFNFISLWSFLNTLQLLIYMRLCSIYIPPKLNLVLKTFRSINMLPSLFGFIRSSSSEEIDGRYYNFGFTSSNIFINTGPYMTALLITIGNMLVIISINRFKHKKPFSYDTVASFVESSLLNFRYCAYLRLYIQSYLDLVVCSLIGIITLSFQTVFEVFSLMLCFFFLSIAIMTPILAMVFIRTHKQQILEHDITLYKQYGSLFYEFYNDRGLFVSLYYFFFFSRRLLFTGILILLSDYPVLQIILNFVLSVSVIAI